MTEKEIETTLSSVEKIFQNLFLGEVKRCDLNSILPFCFPFFEVNVKQKKYFFYVIFDFEIVLNQNLFWENIDGNKKLISIDKFTGERKIVVSISYESQTIFKTSLDFENRLVPSVSQSLEVASLIEVIKNKKLVVNKAYKSDFNIGSGR